jgi:hypothetical protein
MTVLVEDLLLLARLDAGRPLERTEVRGARREIISSPRPRSAASPTTT